MSITMQGTWAVSVRSKDAAFPQRFIISGASSGNGVYAGETTTPAVTVTGAQWVITIQHNPTGPPGWTPSADRITFPTASGGQVRFDIQSNDTGADVDYNDLILTCAMTASPADYVIYGNVETYAGLCRFNPCFPFPWVVIDSPFHLVEALKYPAIRKVLEELYPERIRQLLGKRGVIRPPKPEPDPPPFIPLMIPLGTLSTEEQRVSLRVAPAALETGPALGREQPALRSRAVSPEASVRSLQARLEPAKARPVRLELGAAVLGRVAPYARDISKISDIFRIGCTTSDAPGLLLRFLEYDRTADELAGGPYTGTGNRQVLGLAVTDERGNYIFRFTQTLEDIAAEFDDIVAGGAPLATQLRPDIIVQVVGGVGGSPVLYESGLHTDILNLRRIDLCFPENVLNPGITGCQGGIIQGIGNITTVPGVGNTLDAAGRITATNPNGPNITRGAWAGTLDFFACFEDQPAAPVVKYYTIRFRSPGGPWAFVQELYTHTKFMDIVPGYTGTPVGPANRSLAVDGGVKVNVPSYLNIENDLEWAAYQRLRKVRLTSAFYENALYGPADSPRSVQFKIEGYNDTGDKVMGADATITLFIDNRAITADISGVSMGALSPGECALFELPNPNEPLTVRFKVRHPGGFVQSYGLGVIRGSNTGVPVSDTTLPTQPLSLTYSLATHGSFFFGTFNGVAPDADEYVVAELQADAGAWLPAGENFCAFEFRIDATYRVTDGYSAFWGGTLDKELIGISYPPPGP